MAVRTRTEYVCDRCDNVMPGVAGVVKFGLMLGRDTSWDLCQSCYSRFLSWACKPIKEESS